MNRLLIAPVAAAVLVAAPAAAWAGPASGDTTLLGPPTAGTYVDVDVSLVTTSPVVAYEYAAVNRCWFDGKASGPADSYQRDDIVNWLYSSPEPYGSVPHAIVQVDLTPVPSGSTCKVSLVKGNTLVKGSVTTYLTE